MDREVLRHIADNLQAIAESIETMKADATKKIVSINDLASEFKHLNDIKNLIGGDKGGIKAEIQKIFDQYRKVLIPDCIENTGLESPIKITGIGKLVLNTDMNVSIREGKKEAAYVWLTENGYGDIVTETINSSKLKSTVKEITTKGGAVPIEIFNVNPFTYATINKL